MCKMVLLLATIRNHETFETASVLAIHLASSLRAAMHAGLFLQLHYHVLTDWLNVNTADRSRVSADPQGGV